MITVNDSGSWMANSWLLYCWALSIDDDHSLMVNQQGSWGKNESQSAQRKGTSGKTRKLMPNMNIHGRIPANSQRASRVGPGAGQPLAWFELGAKAWRSNSNPWKPSPYHIPSHWLILGHPKKKTGHHDPWLYGGISRKWRLRRYIPMILAISLAIANYWWYIYSQ